MFRLTVRPGLVLEIVNPLRIEEEFALVEKNREHLAPFLSWVDLTHSVDDLLNYARRMREEYASGRAAACMILLEDRLAGTVSLHARSDENARRGEIGYWLGQEYTGRGIMTDCVRVLLDHSFSTLGYNKILIRCATTNVKSRAIPIRLGLAQEGTARQEQYVRDTWLDIEHYAAFASEWPIERPGLEFEWRVDDEIALRLLRPQHAEALFALTEANREHLGRWLPWVDSTLSADDERSFIQAALRDYIRWDGMHMGIWWRGELVGTIGFHHFDIKDGKTEIGYWLSETQTGQGIITRATRACTDFALGPLGLNRVEILCATGNERSAAVPRRLGYTHELIKRQSNALRGEFQDMHVFAMLKQDWTPTP